KDIIIQRLEQQGIRERIAEQRIQKIVDQSGGAMTREDIITRKTDSLARVDSETKYLIQEYHDGLLLYEISNREVWDKGAKDEAGLAAYFKAHKKDYAWEEPRFKGMVYHVKDKADVKAVKNCVKKLPFDQWAEVLRSTFNPDSVIRIRVEKGLFKQGDNPLVDKEIFKQNTTVTPVEGYPIDAVFGKVLKKGPEDYTDVRGQVTADYQDMLEKNWVTDLRRRYPVTVNKDVLKTVNKHQ
ncbi:MAG: peptidylprolyl isomerase, partial [Prevotella sp.]|nr:peptidylprolyl isomerase [Prevotella sp.]